MIDAEKARAIAKKYYEEVFLYCYSILNCDKYEAEVLTQEVFLFFQEKCDVLDDELILRWLLVVAKNDKSHADLASQIAEHSCKRTYIALLEGNLKQETGTLTTNLERDKKNRKKYTVSNQGKIAITHYNVLERNKGYTLVKFELETGRTHQIRVHSKHLGHPIVGDKTYGFTKQKFILDGQLLHAIQLQLAHPTTKKQMIFEAPIPSYFEKTLLKLKKN